MQLPARAGVESENGPKLIASNAPAAQTLAPQYRHSSRPDGKYSSQGGAANPAMGGGPTSESAQAHSLQSSNLAGSPAGNPNAPRSGNTQGKDARRVGLSSGPALAGAAQAGAAKGVGSDVAAPTEVRSSGGQREVATTGAPINPLAINSAGGTGNKGAGNKSAAAGTGSDPTTGGDASQPGGRGGSSRMAEGGGAGQLMSASGAGRGIAPTARSMSASIVPDGVGSSTARQADASGAAPMQQIQAQGTAYATEERYAAKEVQAYSPKSVCELPMMMAGFDRRPLPEGLASIMGSESAMVMETPPVLLPGNIQPTYPLAALGSRLQGKIVLRTQVLTSGQVGEVFVRESNNQSPILSQAAIGTVRNWRFKPAQRNGKPVPAWVNIPIEYRNPS
jgi:TonB family protein